MRVGAILGSVIAAVSGVAVGACSVVAGLGDYRAAGPDGGGGGGGGAAACDASTNGPLVLESSVTPLHLAIRSSTGDAYWTEVPSPTSTIGSVMHAPPCGTSADVFQGNASFPPTDIDLTTVPSTVGAIAVDDQNVYWASGATIARAPIDGDGGAGAEVFVDETNGLDRDWIEAIAIMGTRLCWIHQVPGSALSVESVDVDGPPLSAPTVLDPNLQHSPTFLAMAVSNDGHLFVATDVGVYVTGHPEASGSLTALGTGNAIVSLGTLGPTAYWGELGGFIYSLDSSYIASGPELVESGQLKVFGIATGTGRVWWTVGQGLPSAPPGGVVSAAFDGGGLETVVPGQNTPTDIAVTGKTLFWLDRGDVGAGNGAVVRVGL